MGMRWPHHSWREMHQSFRLASQSRYTCFQRAGWNWMEPSSTTRAAGLLQGVHGHEPLLGLPGLQLGMAAVAGHDGMVVVLHVIEQAQLVEGGHDGLAGLVAVHAGELPVAFHDMGRLVEDVDALKTGALAHGPVVGVMRRRHLHAARAELGIHVPVGEDGDLAVHERQLHRLAHEVPEALVLGIDGHAGVAQHRFGARGGRRPGTPGRPPARSSG